MSKSFLCICALLAFFSGRSSASPKTSVFVTSESKTDTPVAPGQASSEAAAWARAMELFTAQALAARYPCTTSLTPSDVQALLGHQRDLEILGKESDPAALAAIGNRVNAQYVVNINLIQVGGRSSVTASLIDVRSARTVVRDSRVIPVHSGAADSLETFAKAFVNSFGDSFPKCRTPGAWNGTITVSSSTNLEDKTGPNAPVTETASSQLTCQLSGAGSDANCSYSGTSTLAGRRGSSTGTSTADNARVDVTVSVNGKSLYVTIGYIPVMTTSQNSILGSSQSKSSLSPQSYTLPASPDPNRQSGSWSDTNPIMEKMGMKKTVTWNLSR